MNVLLVQTSFLGDTILSTPVIAALQDKYPDARLTTLTTKQSAELLRHDPLIVETITFDKRDQDAGVRGICSLARRIRNLHFDRAYGMQRSVRTSLLLALSGIPLRIGFAEAKAAWLYHRLHSRSGYRHEVERNLAIVGREVADASDQFPLRISPPPEADLSARVCEIVRTRHRYVVMAPGSVWATKRWDITHYQRCASLIAKRGLPIVLVGAPNEKDTCAPLSRVEGVEDLCGQTAISDMVALVANAAAVICNDSMALHLASAFKKPTIALFCSTVPSFGFGPWQNPYARILEVAELPCRPCGRHGRKSCPLGTEHCMRGIGPHQVIDALIESGVLS